jgi:hypothetical protein
LSTVLSRSEEVRVNRDAPILKVVSIAETPVQTPSRRVRWLVSLLVVAHFFAIGTAVTSYSAPNFPAPQLAVAASVPMQPYLQSTFLNNAYRFFAPNPGTPTVMWLRLQHEDRTVRWLELPRPPDASLIRANYQRRLNLALQVGQQIVPDPDRKGKLQFTATGVTCLASVVRHVAHSGAKSLADGKAVPVSSVGVYIVQHAPIMPQQVRDGWTPIDLRTYQAVFVGAFNAEGERIDKNSDLIEQPIAQVVAGVLWADVHPLLRKEADGEAALDSLELPEPIHAFLMKNSDLLDPSIPPEGLQSRIEKRLAGG